ncbi:penicillin-binding protein 2 [Bacterioplanes sanyensis]|uniref:Peptidoglycan D,D-transpeptidase MrdA n=1 Tax=Bacterioplanes sanyensis TaxID=1249553 RepID=A0A222FQD2_9GAMM|nr:penicillin-binding protein 2 [Bacterioplanes sanyensis]ASP40734.1 penicillin-binding protein 2 [Bacterioplanes sanyensis]
MMDASFRDKSAEKRLFQIRALVLAVIILALLGTLAWRMAHLQITEHEKYKDLSENNRIAMRPVAPTRGLIYDRNGVLLAENIPSYSLTLVPERVDDIDTTLAEVERLIGLSERDREAFEQRLELRRSPYEPVVVRHRLDEEEIAQILVNRFFLPGLEVEAQLVRHYPLGESFAHVLGYVGRINAKDQGRIESDEEQKRRYSATHHIGKIGIERRYEDLLHGEVGYQKVETNARGRVIRVLEQQDPIPGQDLTLHLDARLQQRAQQEMQGFRGAAVAIDVNTGGILAFYSNPGFDPNLFVTGISYKDYGDLSNDPDLPLFDRAARGQYPPASTLKSFVGLALLESGVADWNTTIRDPGWFKIDNYDRVYRDWKRSGHGTVDMHKAMVESCDTYFWELSVRMGIDQLSPFLGQFGFGRDTSVDVINALPGLLPDREWKRHHRGSFWFAGDTVNMSIGQGFMKATPLQMATATAVLAAHGRWHLPRLLAATNGEAFEPEQSPPPDIELKDPQGWQRMAKSMEDVIIGAHGTGWRLRKTLKVPMAGKTGTAQVVGIKQNEEYDSEALAERLRDHALFTAFAPVDKPQIAIAVIVENGESAGTTAGPIAQALINQYLAEDQG